MKLVWFRALLPPRLFAYSAKSRRNDCSCSDGCTKRHFAECPNSASSAFMNKRTGKVTLPDPQISRTSSILVSLAQQYVIKSEKTCCLLTVFSVFTPCAISNICLVSRKRSVEREDGTHLGIDQGGAEFADDNGEFLDGARLGGVPLGREPPKGLVQHGPQLAAIHPRLPALHRGNVQGFKQQCRWGSVQ